MTTEYTTNLNGALLAVGDIEKEAILAALANIFDAAIAGYLTKSVAGSANVTLTSTEARNPILVFTGALTGSIFVDIPATGRNREWTVFNNTTGAFTLTMRYNGAGTTVLIPQGQRLDIYHDGTNVLESRTAPLRASVYNSANVSIPNNAYTAVALNAERIDTSTFHDNTTNNTRLTIPAVGDYIFIGSASFDANGTGMRGLGIRLNGTTYVGIPVQVGAIATFGVNLVVVSHVRTYTAITDYVELMAFQDSGAALNILAGSEYSPQLSGWRVA